MLCAFVYIQANLEVYPFFVLVTSVLTFKLSSFISNRITEDG
jgi:hypothetical protein